MITGVPEVAPNRFSLITSSGPLSRVLQATLELARDAAERSPGFMTAA
jgi:hypothetical protein